MIAPPEHHNNQQAFKKLDEAEIRQMYNFARKALSRYSQRNKRLQQTDAEELVHDVWQYYQEKDKTFNDREHFLNSFKGKIINVIREQARSSYTLRTGPMTPEELDGQRVERNKQAAMSHGAFGGNSDADREFPSDFLKGLRMKLDSVSGTFNNGAIACNGVMLIYVRLLCLDMVHSREGLVQQVQSFSDACSAVDKVLPLRRKEKHLPLRKGFPTLGELWNTLENETADSDFSTTDRFIMATNICLSKMGSGSQFNRNLWYKWVSRCRQAAENQFSEDDWSRYFAPLFRKYVRSDDTDGKGGRS